MTNEEIARFFSACIAGGVMRDGILPTRGIWKLIMSIPMGGEGKIHRKTSSPSAISVMMRSTENDPIVLRYGRLCEGGFPRCGVETGEAVGAIPNSIASGFLQGRAFLPPTFLSCCCRPASVASSSFAVAPVPRRTSTS